MQSCVHCAHVHMCVHACTLATHAHVVHACAHVHTCACVHMHSCMSIHAPATHVHPRAHIHACAYTHAHMHARTYVHRHNHTPEHTCARTPARTPAHTPATHTADRLFLASECQSPHPRGATQPDAPRSAQPRTGRREASFLIEVNVNACCPGDTSPRSVHLISSSAEGPCPSPFPNPTEQDGPGLGTGGPGLRRPRAQATALPCAGRDLGRSVPLNPWSPKYF